MMNRKMSLLIITVAILAAVVSMACDCPPPEPAYCSPGFWKQPHHFQYWVGYEPDDMYNADMTLLDALQGGKDTRVSRFVVAGWLNEAYPDAPCD
jgi:hypothetical protein